MTERRTLLGVEALDERVLPSRFAGFEPQVRLREADTTWVVFVGVARAETPPTPTLAAARVAAPVTAAALPPAFFAPADAPPRANVDPVEPPPARPASASPEGSFARLTATSAVPVGVVLSSDGILPELAPRLPEVVPLQPEVAPPPYEVTPIEVESAAALVLRRLGAEAAALGDGFARVLDFVTGAEEHDEPLGYAWYAGGVLLTAWAGYALWVNRNERPTTEVRHEMRIA